MLKSLSVKNYALIESLEIKFDKGLTIITGETGAGKSILLGALSLILGQRADTSSLKDTSKSCIIEAAFDISMYGLKPFFNNEDIDYDETTVIRRQINANGKSRSFINDMPVNLHVLKKLGSKLVDIHSQHENLLVSDMQFQLLIVDTYTAHSEVIEEYRKCYKQYKKTQKEFINLAAVANAENADIEYFRHRFDEIETAQLQLNEQEKLENEREILTYAEEIKTNLDKTSFLLSNDDQSIVGLLKECVTATEQIQNYFPKASEIAERLNSSYIELKDLANETEIVGNDIEFDSNRIEYVNQRLDLIYSLQQKHKVSSIKEILEIKEELQNKLNDITSYEDRLNELEKQTKLHLEKVEKLACTISKNRKKTIPQIEKIINEMLAHLGMPNGKFKIEIITNKDYTSSGCDMIAFLFSANKHAECQEISKIASGGEISRLMLSIKSLISESKALPTIIFDEIDSGVSGDIADKMGNIIKKMSGNMQVINITHLPQVAGKGDYHFMVYKEDSNETTSTRIKKLTGNDRINEIAKMLSGNKLTNAAIENAKELMQQ